MPGMFGGDDASVASTSDGGSTSSTGDDVSTSASSSRLDPSGSSSTVSGSSGSLLGSSVSGESTGAELPTITGFQLADADADVILHPIVDGVVIDPADYGGAALTIVADTEPEPVGSVRFFVNGVEGRTENYVPYTASGNNDSDLGELELAPGMHVLEAQPFTQANAEGEMGLAATLTFELL